MLIMKTRIQKLLVGAALVATTTLAQAQFTYTNNGNGTCTINGYTGPGGAVTIPDSIAGLTVVSIGSEAFFYNHGLTSVTIPGSVTSIGNAAFLFCSGLTNITLGSGVTSIGSGAFEDCTGLTSVTIPGSVTNIGGSAFFGCTNVTTYTVDPANSVYSSADGVLFDKGQSTLIQCPGVKTGSYAIPGSVTSIGSGAFFGCTSLTNVTIGSGVTSIGSEAFESCTSLTSVAIPGSVTNIGDNVFYSCDSLTAITVDPANSFYSSADGVLFDKNQSTLFRCPGGKTGSYVVPGSVTYIGAWAFEACYSLTSVTFGNGVTNIGDATFFGCGGLTSVTIPGSVTNIGGLAFEGCTSLTNVTIGSGVTSIGSWAFEGCGSLTSVIIPGSVTYIGDYAFSGCLSLSTAFFLGNAPAFGADVFVEDIDVGYLPDPVTVYYLSGATGWGSVSFVFVSAELWNPQASALRVTGGHFGFDITGPAYAVIVVEACTNLAQPFWLPVSTNALNSSGASSFSDSESGNYPARFYRFRSP